MTSQCKRVPFEGMINSLWPLLLFCLNSLQSTFKLFDQFSDIPTVLHDYSLTGHQRSHGSRLGISGPVRLVWILTEADSLRYNSGPFTAIPEYYSSGTLINNFWFCLQFGNLRKRRKFEGQEREPSWVLNWTLVFKTPIILLFELYHSTVATDDHVYKSGSVKLIGIYNWAYVCRLIPQAIFGYNPRCDHLTRPEDSLFWLSHEQYPYWCTISPLLAYCILRIITWLERPKHSILSYEDYTINPHIILLHI